MLHSTRQDRHSGCFTSSIEDCAYRLSTIFESPSIGAHSTPIRLWSLAHPLTRSPAQNGGAQGRKWASAEDLSLPASDDMRPIDFFEYRSLEGNDRRPTNRSRGRRIFCPVLKQPRLCYRTGLSLQHTHISISPLPAPRSQMLAQPMLVRRVLQVFQRS